MSDRSSLGPGAPPAGIGGSLRIAARSRNLYQALPPQGEQIVESGRSSISAKLGALLTPGRSSEAVSTTSVAEPDSLEDSDSDGESVAAFSGEPLDEDLYGVSIASLLRDLRKIILGHGNFCLRLSRLTVTVIMLTLLVALQFFLVVEMKFKVTPQTVRNIRALYDKFEEAVYGNHTFHTVNGYDRGEDGHFDERRFDELDTEFKDSICSMPLAHPLFFGSILLIWTFTVVVDIRRLIFLSVLFTYRVKTVSSMHDIFLHDDDERHGRPLRNEDQKVVLSGLTPSVKALLMTFIFLPRLVLDLVLLWLGCRWLASTDNLEDVFLNAVALEFILWLKDLIYLAVIPERNKVESQELLIPMDVLERANYRAYLGAFIWLLLACTWVPFYMFWLQSVLPDYKWDVRDICNQGQSFDPASAFKDS